MASLYVRMADEKICIIISHNERVKRLIPCNNFPYLGLSRDVPVPQSSLTRRFSRGSTAGSCSDLEDVPTHSWLEARGQVTALYEQVLIQKEGWTTTLLMVDEDDVDDEDDDRNWNRRNS